MLLNLFFRKTYGPVRTSGNANAIEITFGLIYGGNAL
jgi:hypothetical protein